MRSCRSAPGGDVAVGDDTTLGRCGSSARRTAVWRRVVQGGADPEGVHSEEGRHRLGDVVRGQGAVWFLLGGGESEAKGSEDVDGAADIYVPQHGQHDDHPLDVEGHEQSWHRVDRGGHAARCPPGAVC